MGTATDYLTGIGIFQGKSSSGIYVQSVGDPAGDYFAWDGSHLITSGNWINGSALNPSLQTWETNMVFSSVSDTQVNWTSGTVVLSDSTSYSVVSGNTGTMSALTYIYLDTAISLTILQHTTTYSTAVGDGKILVASAQNATAGASVLPYSGQQPIINGGIQINALSILTGNLAAGAVTAAKISVTNLQAINALMGQLTIDDKLTMNGASGAITIGTTPPTSATVGTGLWIDRNGVYSLNSNVQNATLTNAGITAGGGATKLDIAGARVIVSTSESPARAYTFTNADGSVAYGGMYGYLDTGIYTTRIRAVPTANTDSTVWSLAEAPSGKLARNIIGINDQVSGAYLELRSQNGGAILWNPETIGEIQFNAGSSGFVVTSTAAIRLQPTTSFVINDDNNAVDTRVASDTRTHAFFVNGTSGYAGINNDNPLVDFDVVGAIAASTSLTTPLLIGGSGTTQTLTHKTTTGIGAAGADHIFLVGNNGATEAMRILNSGNIGIGTAAPSTSRLMTKGSTNDNTAIALSSYNSDDTVLFQVRNDGLVYALSLRSSGAFGCNSKTAQTAYASGGDITPGAGAFGASSAANFAAMVTLVKNIRSALVANGIMS